MYLTIMYLIFAQLAGPSNCGMHLYRDAVETAKSLILSKAPLKIPNVELARKSGTCECVRLTFRIDKNGRAFNINVADSSHNYVMNVAGVRALKKYRFKVPSANERKQFTLIFSGLVGVAPPFPTNTNRSK